MTASRSADTATTSLSGLDGQVQTWVEEELGGSVVSAKRTFGGGTRATWFLRVEGRDGTRDVVGRIELGQSPFTGTAITLAREAVVYRALASTDVRLPELLAEDPQGRALLLERLPGTSDLLGLPEEERHAALLGLMDQLACLHRCDTRAMDLPGFTHPRTAEDHALVDLEVWRTLAERCSAVPPEVHFAFAWLETHAPTDVARTVLVQGDTGPGNMMVVDGEVIGLIDWEFAHLGDPHDDLAWLLFRATGQRRRVVDDMSPYLHRYAQESGRAINPSSLAYYQVLVQLRCAITTLLTIEQGGNLGIAMYEAYHRQFVKDMMEAIAECEGLEVPQPRTEAAGTRYGALYDRVLAALAHDIRPDASSTSVKLAVNESISTLQHLRAVDAHGAVLYADDRAELDHLLGDIPEGQREVQLEERARTGGAQADREVLSLLLQRSRREAVLWADVLA